MKLKTLILSGLTCLSLSACTSTPVIPQLTAGVLQEVKKSEGKIILFIEVNFVLCTEIQKNHLLVDLCYYLQPMISSFVFVILIMI